MNHFDAVIIEARLSKTAKAYTPGEVCLLRRIEIEKTQQHRAGAIGQVTYQRAPTAACTPPAAVTHFGVIDHALDNRVLTMLQGTDGYDTRPVFITQGQMEQQILYPVNTQLLQSGCHRGTNALEHFDRLVFEGPRGCRWFGCGNSWRHMRLVSHIRVKFRGQYTYFIFWGQYTYFLYSSCASTQRMASVTASFVGMHQ